MHFLSLVILHRMGLSASKLIKSLRWCHGLAHTPAPASVSSSLGGLEHRCRLHVSHVTRVDDERYGGSVPCAAYDGFRRILGKGGGGDPPRSRIAIQEVGDGSTLIRKAGRKERTFCYRMLSLGPCLLTRSGSSYGRFCVRPLHRTKRNICYRMIPVGSFV